MTNPYQHGPSGFYGDPANLPTGLPGFGQRRSSYASVAARASSFPFTHLLNPVSDGADSHGYAARDHDADMLRNGVEQNGNANRLQGPRNPQLATFSRAFEVFMRTPPQFDAFGPLSTNAGFFTPSYLRDSTYVQKLEDQHKAKLLAQREGQAMPSQGSGVPGSGSSLRLHGSKLAPPPHRG